MIIQSIIIDDEKPARDLLRELLKKHKEIRIIGEAENGFEALKLIQELKPQLIFLDIQMPKVNGFELLEVLDNRPAVIFITAYSEYAIKAFESNAIDYLLKPIDPARLNSALEKASERIDPPGNMNLDKMLDSRLIESEKLEKVVVKSGNKIHILSLDSIQRIEAQDDYVSFICPNGKFLKKQTMKYLETHLPVEQFIRVHRSHIINISQLEKLEPYSKDNHIAVLENGDRVPISSSGYQELRKKLDF